MSEGAQEVWQVEVNGTVYEAPLAELGDWIGGGSLLPADKVRKGQLRWIEAGKVPALAPFFAAKLEGRPLTVSFASPEQATAAEPIAAEPAPSVTANEAAVTFENRVHVGDIASEHACLYHPERESAFVCDGCKCAFCRDCVKSYGGSVFVCSACGSMCRRKGDVVANERKAEGNDALANEPFGFADFARAIGFPFRFKSSLVFGVMMFCFFSLGQKVTGMGGIFMFASAFVCAMLANTLTFGILSNTVDNFVQGKLDENFMPSFDDFSAWDDVVHPFFLSIGAYLAAFLPFFLVFALGTYIAASSVSQQTDIYQERLEKIPGTDAYRGRKLAEQTGDVKKVLRDLQLKERERVDSLANTSVESNSAPAAITDDPAGSLADPMANAGDELPISPSKDEGTEWFKGAMGVPAPLVIVSFLMLLWGAFLFPATSAVAGYTRSFWATINPLVALDTVRHLGLRYVTLIVMALSLLLVLFVVRVAAGVVFAPLAIPMFGNIPADLIGSVAGFYLWIVFSCLVGFLLFKSADRLKLSR